MAAQRWIGGALVAAALAMAGAAHAQEAQLRDPVVAAGPAVTLGDLFVDAGEAAGRAVAPAPAPGRTAQFSARFVSAAAAAAGVAWTPPEGLTQIEVRGAGGRGAGAARLADDMPGVRRGDPVTLVYVAPGLQLTTRARALTDAAIGEPVRLVNLQSNRTVEAIVTGPGAASASPDGR